jgi:hypothetical protein
LNMEIILVQYSKKNTKVNTIIDKEFIVQEVKKRR